MTRHSVKARGSNWLSRSVEINLWIEADSVVEALNRAVHNDSIIDLDHITEITVKEA